MNNDASFQRLAAVTSILGTLLALAFEEQWNGSHRSTVPQRPARTVPPRFLSFISVFSQIQLREPSYTYVQYGKTEALATASSKVQRKGRTTMGAYSNHLFSREQSAVIGFNQAASLVREVADDGRTPSLLNLIDYMTDAVSEFGLAELYARQAGRYNTLGIEAELARTTEGMRDRHNERGLRFLDTARKQSEGFQGEIDRFFDEFGGLGNLRDQTEVARATFIRNVAELEIKPEDAAKIVEASQQVFNLLTSGNVRRLPELLRDNLNQLEELRGHPTGVPERTSQFGRS